MLGLIQDADQFDLIPDYSLTLEEVQIGAAAFFITHGDDCSILTYAKGVDIVDDKVEKSMPPSIPSRIPSWAPIWDRRYRSAPVPRGSKTFGAYEILRSEHVATHVISKSILDNLVEPRIHHNDGSLSILALKLINLSRLTDLWVKYLDDSTPNDILEFYPGLCLLLNAEANVNQDSIILLKGCETIFHIRENPERSESNRYHIIGVCNILLSLDQNRDQSVNISELDIVSHFILQRCPLERKHLQ
jgi:hypothetical protein